MVCSFNFKINTSRHSFVEFISESFFSFILCVLKWTNMTFLSTIHIVLINDLIFPAVHPTENKHSRPVFIGGCLWIALAIFSVCSTKPNSREKKIYEKTPIPDKNEMIALAPSAISQVTITDLSTAIACWICSGSVTQLLFRFQSTFLRIKFWIHDAYLRSWWRVCLCVSVSFIWISFITNYSTIDWRRPIRTRVTDQPCFNYLTLDIFPRLSPFTRRVQLKLWISCS